MMSRSDKSGLRAALTVLAAWFAVSCGPVSYLYEMEAAKPSQSDIDLKGKLAAVLVNSDLDKDSLKLASFSSGLAGGLESGLGMESGTMAVYAGNADSDFLDQFADTDILFVIDDVEGGSVRLVDQSYADDGYNTIVVNDISVDATYQYRIFNVADRSLLKHVNKHKEILFNSYSEPGMSSEDILRKSITSQESVYEMFGSVEAAEYFPSWEKQQRVLLVFESDDDWVKAYLNAVEFKVDEAMAYWLKMTDDKSPRKASAAAYNLAVMCELSGEYAMAVEWLDISDAKYRFSVSYQERQIIESLKKKIAEE